MAPPKRAGGCTNTLKLIAYLSLDTPAHLIGALVSAEQISIITDLDFDPKHARQGIVLAQNQGIVRIVLFVEQEITKLVPLVHYFQGRPRARASALASSLI